jgi:hypothetical protein
VIPLAAIAGAMGKLSAILAAVETYRTERAKLIAQYGQGAANDLPDLEAVIAAAKQRIDAWDSDIDGREARLEALRAEGTRLDS